jgi:hypothetical protein
MSSDNYSHHSSQGSTSIYPIPSTPPPFTFPCDLQSGPVPIASESETGPASLTPASDAGGPSLNSHFAFSTYYDFQEGSNELNLCKHGGVGIKGIEIGV